MKNPKTLKWLVILVVLLMAASCSKRVSNAGRSGQGLQSEATGPAGTLASSLHGTARGMQWWYEQSDGFGAYSGVSYEDAGCGHCHVSTCNECHEDVAGTKPAIEPDSCSQCHGRIMTETRLKVSDIHFEKKMVCSDCHSSDEVHGDGKQYNSMFSPGAMDTRCENCHKKLSDNAEHNQHGADFHCDACHLETVITCYNCHFETLIKKHEKKAAGALTDYIILLNDVNGKIRAGSYQSVVYGDKTFVAFGPYHSHAVMSAGRTCKDCHSGERMLELRDTGKIVMTLWDDDKSKVTHTTGVIPFVPDKFQFQFVTLEAEAWVPLPNKPARIQYEFCSPLTAEQLKRLGAAPAH